MAPIQAYIDTPSGTRIYAEKHPRAARKGHGTTENNKGEGDEVPLLFIHGYLSCSCTLGSLLPYLSGRTIITYDLEGYGKSSKPSSPPTLDSICSHAEAVLSHFGYPLPLQLDVLTYTMGCCIAIHLALTNPKFKIRKLILVAPPDLSEPKELWQATAQQIRSQGLDDLLVCFLSSLGTRARANAELRARIRQQMHKHLSKNRNFIADLWVASSSLPDECARAQKSSGGGNDALPGDPRRLSLAQDTWVFWGMEDGQSHRGVCEAVARMTNAKIIALDTGHYFSWEDPKIVGEELKKILDPLP